MERVCSFLWHQPKQSGRLRNREREFRARTMNRPSTGLNCGTASQNSPALPSHLFLFVTPSESASSVRRCASSFWRVDTHTDMWSGGVLFCGQSIDFLVIQFWCKKGQGGGGGKEDFHNLHHLKEKWRKMKKKRRRGKSASVCYLFIDVGQST